MSDVGLQIKNAGGNITVDSSYENLVLRDQKTMSSNSGSTSSDYVSFSGRDSPVVVVGNTGGKWGGLKWTQKLGSEFRYQFIAESGSSIDYYAFDTPDEPTDLEYGLQIWNGNGTSVFHSSYPYLRILDVFNVATGGEDIEKTYDRKIGVVLNRSWQKVIPIPMPGVWRTNYLSIGVNIDHNVLDIKSITLDTRAGADNAHYPDTVPIIVVDLSSVG